jgi:chromosome segregation ATPase
MQELTEFNIEKTTAEILILKDQTAQNIIEIGKRLIKVKENLEHGEFTEWLKQKVDISHRTANNFMKVATTFSNSQAIANLSSTKLFLLAGLEEEERQEVMQENNVEDMTTRELEKVVKEKKQIKEQLEAEQEYSNELQEAIKEKEEKIRTLQAEIEKIQIPEKEIVEVEKEVVKEVIPENLMKEKEMLKQSIAEQKQQLETLQKRAEKAESTLKSIRLEDNLEKDRAFDTAKLDMLIANINDFLAKNSKFTYLKEDLQNIPSKKKKFVEASVNSIKEWVMLMEQALDNRQDVVGNIIFGEGEIINE